MPNHLVLGALCLAIPVVLPAAAASAEELDQAAFDRGQEIYAEQCAACHQAGGEGMPPTFPALRGNAALEDVELIVERVRLGLGAMPAFPQLDAEDLAAVASYIRNDWGNDFGGVSAEATLAALDALEVADDAAASIWDGVYTEEQAARGEPVYNSACALCHGRRLDGAAADPDMRASPPLARARFLQEWEARPVGTLYSFTQATMPQHNPGSLTDQQYIDVIAYMFSVSDIPPGDTELAPDLEALGQIVIEPAPE